MQLTRLTVRDLRLIEAAELAPGPGLNLLVGANASGKTTLLEAIYLLGRGRPLRQRHAARLIRDGREQMLVSGSLSERDGSRHVLGVARAAGRLELRRDGQAARSSLELAALLPLQFIHPEIHHLVQAGPVLRRQFLDRGLFHVEPNFLDGWRRYQRALRQRNAALKSGTGIAAWDRELATHGERLDRQRRDYLAGLAPGFRRMADQLLGDDRVELVYRRGWPAQLDLAAALSEGLASDRRHGFTHRGAHRADFTLRLEGIPVHERASRGQQKLLLCALQLAQAELQRASTGRGGLLLVDDLPAELDAAHRERLLAVLQRLEVQAFVTATERGQLDPGGATARWFHVEHGRVGEMV